MWLLASGSRKNREYEDKDEEDFTESGEDDSDDTELFEELVLSRGKTTAIVPPLAARVVSPHMVESREGSQAR